MAEPLPGRGIPMIRVMVAVTRAGSRHEYRKSRHPGETFCATHVVRLLSCVALLWLAAPVQAQLFSRFGFSGYGFPANGAWRGTYQGPATTNYGYGRTSLPRSLYYVPAVAGAVSTPAVAVPALPSPIVYAPPVAAQPYPPVIAPATGPPLLQPVAPTVVPAGACSSSLSQPYTAPSPSPYGGPGTGCCPQVAAPSCCQPTFTPAPY